MIEKICIEEIKELRGNSKDWKKLHLNDDIKSLLLGSCAFSRSDKEIISLKKGFYKLLFEKHNNISERLKAPIELVIFDEINESAFKTYIGE